MPHVYVMSLKSELSSVVVHEMAVNSLSNAGIDLPGLV